MLKRNLKLIPIILILLFIAGCGTMNVGQVPWYKAITDWQPKQRADFMMSMWLSEKQSYDTMNAIENKPADLIKTLEVKNKILEESRVPMRMYVTMVNAGGTPDQKSEQQLVDWLRQLQIQLIYQ
jgi:hypothetical protein